MPSEAWASTARPRWPLWSALITLGLMALLLLGLSRMIEAQAAARARAEVRADLAAIAVADALAPGLGPLETIARAGRDRTSPGYYLVIDPETWSVLGGNLSAWPPGLRIAPRGESGLGEARLGEAVAPGLGRLTLGQARLDDHFPVLVARRNEDFAQPWIWTWWTFLALSGVVLGFTVWASDRESRRLRRGAGEISAALEAFAAGQRSARASAGDGAMGQLAHLTNRTLDVLDRTIANDRAFADTIAHQLRTPISLAHMRLSQPVAAAEAVDLAQAALESLLSDIDTVVDLNHLAEHGLKRQGVVNLAPLVVAIVDLMEPLAEAKGVRITTTAEPAHIDGEASLLKQALANVVANAIKYGPAGGEITVICGLEREDAVVRVLDQGPGVAGLPEVIGLFRRGPAGARVDGRGLGLHLAVEVVAAHAGRLVTADRPSGGLDLAFRFPRRLPS